MVDVETVGAGGGSVAWVDDGGALRAVNSGDGSTNLVGVVGYGGGGDAGDDYESGEGVPVHVDGSAVIASVASGVSAGDELGPSATDGQLGTGSAGVDALTDEGDMAGLSSNESIPAGYAAINF
jgi:N-methylhydantoinase A